MKSIVSIFLLLFALSASAVTFIEGTLTLTNTPSDGNTVTINGTTRTWKNQPVSSVATQIGITNSVGGNATNAFQQLAAYPIANLTLSFSSTNKLVWLTRADAALTISMVGTWGSVAYVTNTSTAREFVSVPFTAIPGATNRTNQASSLVTGISTYSTTALSQASTAASELVGLTNNQTITGSKIFPKIDIGSASLPAPTGSLSSGAANYFGVTNSGSQNFLYGPIGSTVDLVFGSSSLSAVTNLWAARRLATTTDLYLIAYNDAGTSGTNAMSFTRAGQLVTVGPGSPGDYRFNVFSGRIGLYGDTTNSFRFLPSGVDIVTISGSPEAVTTANKGSLALDSSGLNTVGGYLKNAGAGNTGWAPIITGYTNGINPRVCSATAAIDWPSIATVTNNVQTITVVGAITNSHPAVMLGWDTNLPPGVVVQSAWVSATNTVSISLFNTTGGSVNPNSMNVRATVLQP